MRRRNLGAMIKKNVENFLSLLGEGIDRGGLGIFSFLKKKWEREVRGFTFYLFWGVRKDVEMGFLPWQHCCWSRGCCWERRWSWPVERAGDGSFVFNGHYKLK